MNNKSIITIILAILLALVCAFYISKREKTLDSLNVDQQNVSQEVVIEESVKEESETVDSIENQQAENLVVKKDFAVKNSTKKEEKKPVEDQTVVENVVQEASIVEEVSDYGIIKDENGNIIVTRTFGKYPIKYSFRDFGIIDKVSTK